jgi:hypothetical protein
MPEQHHAFPCSKPPDCALDNSIIVLRLDFVGVGTELTAATCSFAIFKTDSTVSASRLLLQITFRSPLSCGKFATDAGMEFINSEPFTMLNVRLEPDLKQMNEYFMVVPLDRESLLSK